MTARPAILAAGLLAAGFLRAAEVIPPRPARYFNDYAGVVSPTVADSLNRQLEEFERDTTNQLLVAIYPKMQSDSSVADYAVRVAQAWGVGQRGRNNGAVLFVFAQDHQIFIKTGYGLEGALPDGLCRLIIDRELKPRFRQGDYAGGLAAGVAAIIATTRGEYQGTGQTVADSGASARHWGGIGAVVLLLVFVSYLSRNQRSTVYRSGGRDGGSIFWFGGGGGGGGFGGGGGGFSGGGGSFGGGGAGGSW